MTALLLSFGGGAARGDATASARDHFNKGTTLYDLARYREAAAEYELAYQAKNDPAILYNIAQVWRLAGESAKAVTFYKSYLRRIPNADNRAQVEIRIAELQKATEQMEHTKQGPPEGAMRLEDNRPSPEAPVVPPPAVTITAPSSEPRPIDAKPSSSWRMKRNAGIGLVAGGIAFLAVGGAFVALASQANGEVITSDNRFSASAEDRRNGYQLGDAVCFAVGGAAVVTGAVLWALGARESRVRVSASIQPGSFSASLSGSF